MEFIDITKENLENEHICCAISNNKDIQVSSKKNWMLQQFDCGLEFIKANERGKCFIEYIPSQYAWMPINSDNDLVINCLWVSGKLKGHGYSRELLDKCISRAKELDKNGIIVLSSSKKRGFLSDEKFFLHHGFVVVDHYPPYFDLLYLKLKDDANTPSFQVTECKEDGWVIYYSHQCPFVAKYIPLLKEVAINNNINLKTVHIQNLQQARDNPSPWTTFSIFYNRQFITHEIQSPKKFEKLLKELTIKK